MRSKYYRLGSNKVMCSKCGHNFPSDYMVFDKNAGSWVCGYKGYNCWNPLDDIDRSIVPRRASFPIKIQDSYSDYVYCYSDALADVAIADCCTADVVIE